MLFHDLQLSVLSFADRITGGDTTAKGLVVVWLLATVTYFLKSIPSNIWSFIKANQLLQLTITKDGDVLTSELFQSLEKWFITNNLLTIRNMNVTVSDVEDNNGFGYGKHILFCGTRFFVINKVRINQAGSNKVLESLNITTVGRNPKVFKKIIQESKVNKDVRYYWSLSSSYNNPSPWKRITVMKAWPRIFIDEDVKKIIDDKVLFFKNNKQWYIDNNIPYKLTIILHGEPGTGKTSLIRYISDLLESDIFNLVINRAESESFENATKICRKGIPTVIALEDFEAIALSREFISKKRKIQVRLDNEQDVDEKDDVVAQQEHINISLSSFLNTLQGLNPINNIVVVMTTNYLDRVDPAVYRKGRTDLVLEVKPLCIKSIKNFFEYVYKQPFPKEITNINPIKACDMEGYFLDHPENPSAFIRRITEHK